MSLGVCLCSVQPLHETCACTCTWSLRYSTPSTMSPPQNMLKNTQCKFMNTRLCFHKLNDYNYFAPPWGTMVTCDPVIRSLATLLMGRVVGWAGTIANQTAANNRHYQHRPWEGRWDGMGNNQPKSIFGAQKSYNF